MRRAFLNVLPAGPVVEVFERACIGRSKLCELPIASGAISRRHCEITRKGDSFEIRDLGSSGGTFVQNGQLQATAGSRPISAEVDPRQIQNFPFLTRAVRGMV